MRPALRRQLLALAAAPLDAARLQSDPVRFVHRYTDPADQEVAALLASGLAYGRVSLFAPIVTALLDRAEQRGGPAAWARHADPAEERRALRGLYYRFNRTDDLVRWIVAIGAVLREVGSLAAAAAPQPGDADVRAPLTRMVGALRAAALRQPGAPERWELASRGLRFLLVDPSGSSAAKRQLMFARWMVRPADGVDLGLWTGIAPSSLVMPMDTHTHRISRMIGLTARATADMQAAIEVTDALRAIDPVDPVRFDFALAHLGISGGCTGNWQAEVCGGCGVRTSCRVGRRRRVTIVP